MYINRKIHKNKQKSNNLIKNIEPIKISFISNTNKLYNHKDINDLIPYIIL